ncbi:B3 domain-containing protein At2g35310 [Eutrema salsugineum]|uniref:B3 domain-containing protein At2g35310 n=1 Tax=Eutrema salsugineum TaxID=72664 RepID=UPI000CED3A62|nr:B3 domain-containing protein At2g35310 [Eutrema salsugineum]
MATNSDFLMCKEERKNESFFKVLQGADIYSENMRAIPYDFMRSVSEHELSGKMKIRAQWGSSWDIGISKNPRFYFMEKSGWEKFVRENYLGEDDFLTFTHKGKMCFNVKIFKKDGLEMICPQQSMAFFASSSQVKREGDEVVSPDLGPTATETNGEGKFKRKLNSGKKKAKESESSTMIKETVSARRDCAGASSSSSAEFTVYIKGSYLKALLR